MNEAVIRPERPEDFAAIRAVNDAAFGQPGEGALVDRLRGVVSPWISLVAEREDAVAGHVLFTPVTVEDGDVSRPAIALGPMAVAPACQRQGLGGAMIRAGLAECRRIGQPLVFVLGHAEYYPRFGFTPTAPRGIRWEQEVPDEVFLLAELEPGAADGVRGVVRYHPEFSAL